jgi:hypothetical protein
MRTALFEDDVFDARVARAHNGRFQNSSAQRGVDYVN